MKRKMSIGTKITLGFIGLSLISIAVGTFGLYNMGVISNYDDQIYSQELVGLDLIKQANIDILNAIDDEKNFLLASSQQQRTQDLIAVKDAKSRFLANMKKAKPLFVTSEGKALFDQLDAAYQTWDEGQQEVLTLGAHENLKQDSDAVRLSVGEARDKYNALAKIVGAIGSHKEDSAKKLLQESNQAFDASVLFILVFIGLGFTIGIVAGVAISRSISRPVTRFVTELSDASSQIGSSSGQLSQASQEIAAGASEQASQIEETSASMEELASMVRQNVENAQQASLLSTRSKESSQAGSQEMAKMGEAMEGINRSAEDIRNVIDVIEDIAFQTNMLALNAAVEAARAGEAGLGFAVVADEVKNLANRSATSAKETASMIKETNRKIADGLEISKRLSAVFQEIVTNSEKVGEVTREVESASRQQEEGISQVNQAITQFDTVVQNNASSSEETASAAEELQSQVQTLEGVIRQLFLMVTGKELPEQDQ